MKRPGYYVEGQWFRDKFHQARARAAFLAKEYGRLVVVTFVAHESSTPAEVCTIYNGKKETVT